MPKSVSKTSGAGSPPSTPSAALWRDAEAGEGTEPGGGVSSSAPSSAPTSAEVGGVPPPPAEGA